MPWRAPRALSAADEESVLHAAVELGTRSAALVALMAFCGLRVAEVAALSLEDVDGDWVVIRRGKGGHWRSVPAPAYARRLIAAWIAERGREPGPLFEGTPGSGRAISTRRIAQLMDQVGTRAGVSFTPHVLRHTMATRLLRSGIDVVTVAEALGHASVECVQLYSRPTDESLRAALEAGVVGERGSRQ